jgi:hypothetical protein
VKFFIGVLPPAGKDFEISIPLIPRWFAYGPRGRSVYATALKEIGTRSFTDERGIFKVERDPAHVNTIQGLDAFYSIGPFAVSQGEDLSCRSDSSQIRQTLTARAVSSVSPISVNRHPTSFGMRANSRACKVRKVPVPSPRVTSYRLTCLAL